MTDPAAILGRAAALGAAAVLLWAGLEKARHPGAIVTTLGELGMPSGWARPSALALVLAEVGVALALVARPGSAVSVVGLSALGTAFAVAGLVAVGRDEPIRCSCFGRGHDRTLGRTQLLTLPLWIGAGVLAWQWGPSSPSATDAALSLCGVGLSLAAVRAATLVKELARARGDRLYTRRMHPWLSS